MQQLSNDKEKYNALKTRLRLRIRYIRRALEIRNEIRPQLSNCSTNPKADA